MDIKKAFKTIVCVLVLSAVLLTACQSGKQDEAIAGEAVVGKAVQSKDVSITLNSALVVRNTVKANLTVENKGTGDLVIDPEKTFVVTAENEGEAVSMSVDPVSCKNTALTGTIPAGGSLTGDLCWRSDPTLTWPQAAKIAYGGAPGDEGAVVWSVKGE